MLSASTRFIERLQRRDEAAWLELWEVFGHSIERMVESIARRYFSPETVKDIRQETLLEVFRNIERFDPGRGVKLSTWLYSIARHIVSAELTYRHAAKRNQGIKPLSLGDVEERGSPQPAPDEELEKELFRAKVYRAIQLVEKESDFLEFQAYRMRLTSRMRSTEIAAGLGISEPTVSRYLQKVRERLRRVLREVVEEYSSTTEELRPLDDQGLATDREAFDDALADIYATVERDRKHTGQLLRTARRVP
jgi:RNA polymerase sigma factor (sigma-70 family)